jgi:hypothetical protein
MPIRQTISVDSLFAARNVPQLRGYALEIMKEGPLGSAIRRLDAAASNRDGQWCYEGDIQNAK